MIEHPYTFAEGNPVMMVDPEGDVPWRGIINAGIRPLGGLLASLGVRKPVTPEGLVCQASGAGIGGFVGSDIGKAWDKAIKKTNPMGLISRMASTGARIGAFLGPKGAAVGGAIGGLGGAAAWGCSLVGCFETVGGVVGSFVGGLTGGAVCDYLKCREVG
jgi:hypothetical protein